MHQNNSTLRLILAGAAMLAVSLVTPAALAQQHDFNVPAGDAAATIPELARQAGIQVVAPGEHLARVRTPAVKGRMDAAVALQALIANSGLEVAANDGRTITLRQVAAATLKQQPDDGQTDPPAAQPPVSQGSAEDQPASAAAQTPLAASAPAKTLDAVVVTGSMIRRIDAETALPLTTIDRRDIDLSGAATVSDLLQQLPQSAGFDNSETSTGPNDARGDGNSIDLRGLGSGNTLVLLNGRRIAPYPIAGGAVPRLSTNINQIPLGAIERIEVLRDGASAVYGSDAVAGVVNTILKKDYEGLEADVRYGHVQDGGMGTKTASVLAGHNFNDGRTNIMGFAGYYDRTSLDARDKDYMQTGDLRARAHSTDTRWDNRSLSGPYGNFTTGYVDAAGMFHARKVPGMDSSSVHSAPVAGGVGVESGGLPRDLRYNFTPQYMLEPKTRRYQVYGAITHQFDNHVEAFANVFYYHARSYIANATAPISANSDNDIYVPASNYYNPFGTRFYGPGTAHPDTPASDVLIKNYRPVALGERGANVVSRAYQGVAGLRGHAGSWDWEVSAEYGEGKTNDHSLNMMSESRLRAQLALDTPDAFNPFGGPGGNSPAALDAVRIGTWRKGTAGLGIVEAKANGSIFELPGGEAQLAAGYQYRHETFSDARDPWSNGDDVIAQSKSADAKGSRSVNSLFAELYLPFFSDINARPGLQRLEAAFSVRSERYSDFGTATKPKVSLAWSPTKWLLLRGSHSEGFRAPTLAQVFVGEVVRRNTGTADTYRADVTGDPADLGDESRKVVRGGNPNLGPEQAKENSFGFVLQPSFIKNLSVSVDYFRIDQKDVISTFGEADQLDLDAQLRKAGQGSNPDVVRLPVTPDDLAKFNAWNAAHPDDQRAPAGAVDYVKDTYINLAQRKVSGFDLGFSYRVAATPVGNFRIHSNLAYMDTFLAKKDAASPSTEQLEINGLPRWRGMLGATWTLDRYQAGLQANYIGHFKDTSAPPQANGDYYQVASYTTFNGYFGVRLGKAKNQFVRFGVNNLFDRDPPLADEDRGYYDIDANVGRFFYVDWRVRL